VSGSELTTRLKAVPLFSSLSQRELRTLAERGWIGEIQPGHVLCSQGKRGDDFFVVLDGSAAVQRNGRKIGTLAAGQFFGEIALLDNMERTATVTAVTPMRVFTLGRSDFKAALYEGGIAVKLLVTMAARLRASEAQLAD